MFQFDHDRTLEGIKYIMAHLHEPTRERIGNLLYLSDKHHLANFGRFITGDQYSATANGVRPQGAMQLMQQPISAASIDYGEFSGTDVKTLNKIIEQYGEMADSELLRSVCDAAWERAARRKNSVIEVRDIAQACDNAENLLHYLDERTLVCSIKNHVAK